MPILGGQCLATVIAISDDDIEYQGLSSAEIATANSTERGSTTVPDVEVQDTTVAIGEREPSANNLTHEDTEEIDQDLPPVHTTRYTT